MLFLADWTTVRLGDVTVVTYVYAAATAVILLLSAIEFRRALSLWLEARKGAVRSGELGDTALLTATRGSLHRALGWLGIQLALASITAVSVWTQLNPGYQVGYVFRSVFTIAYLSVQGFLGLQMINENVTRRRILDDLDRQRQHPSDL